ncbi:restriction endonuclease [Sphingobium aquiterrae]|uniref:restriction endonuclease n=1 Tax=Sphingobium aquiterrae TaxID=2038656 RepID=UPI0030166644
MNLNLALVLILCAALLAFLIHHYRIPIRHRWRRRQAREMCEQLRGRDRNQPAGIHYARLRAMDPLAFEELLLEAFERRGHRVIRNHRYTGDGGVDGEVIIDGERWLIQAKRYRDAIRPEHVSEFAQLCATRRQRGLFIHTGRTGGMSRAVIDRATGIEIVSGQRLLALLTGAPFEPGSLPPRNYCGRDRSSFRNRTAQ